VVQHNEAAKVGWEVNKMRLCTYPGNMRGKEHCGNPAFYIGLMGEGDCYICHSCLNTIKEGNLRDIDTVPLGAHGTEIHNILLRPFNLELQLYEIEGDGLILHVSRFGWRVIGYKGEDGDILSLRPEDMARSRIHGLRYLPPVLPSYGALEHPARDLVIRDHEPYDDLFITEQQQLVVEHDKAGQLRVKGKWKNGKLVPLEAEDLAFAYAKGMEIAPQNKGGAAPTAGTFVPGAPTLEPTRLHVKKFNTAKRLFEETSHGFIVAQDNGITYALGKRLPSGEVVPIEDVADIEWIKLNNLQLGKFDKELLVESV
jgi:hypothetical protein